MEKRQWEARTERINQGKVKKWEKQRKRETGKVQGKVEKRFGMHWPGIEPGPPAWQARILPLNHQCKHDVSGLFCPTGGFSDCEFEDQNYDSSLTHCTAVHVDSTGTACRQKKRIGAFCFPVLIVEVQPHTFPRVMKNLAFVHLPTPCQRFPYQQSRFSLILLDFSLFFTYRNAQQHTAIHRRCSGVKDSKKWRSLGAALHQPKQAKVQILQSQVQVQVCTSSFLQRVVCASPSSARCVSQDKADKKPIQKEKQALASTTRAAGLPAVLILVLPERDF